MKNTIITNIQNTSFLAMLLVVIASCSRNDDGYLRESEIDATLLPAVDFTASETIIDQDGTVTFADVSTNSPSLYTWTFDGGSPTTSTLANPTVEYPVAGTFSVSLKVRNESGAAETTKEEFITVESVGEPLDPAITVRFNFENSLLNEGSAGGSGVAIGPEGYESGLVGEASYVFDGTNAVTLQGYTGVNGAEPRTVTAWVKTSSTSRETITHWGEQAIGSRASFVLNPDGTLRFEVAGGGINGVTPANDGEWHHVAYTFDGSTVKMYLDGVEDVQWTTNIINTGVGGQTDVEIGSQLGNNIFDGSMDDVRIYNLSLNAGEVGALASQPFNVVKLNFEESLLNEGSLAGAANSTGPESYDTGVVGEASFAFDGTNAITIPDYTGVNGAASRTVTAWIKTSSTTRETITHWGEQAIGSRASFVLNPNGTLRFEVAGGGINGITAANDGEWHHVAYTFDGSTVKMYLDGIEDATWDTDIIDTGVGGETNVEVGAQLGNNVFDGNMDDVRIYNTSLAPETILALSQL